MRRIRSIHSSRLRSNAAPWEITNRLFDPNLPGETRNTVTLKAVAVGTELTVVQTGIPAVIPTEACYLGWQESLQLLALLVEQDIPG